MDRNLDRQAVKGDSGGMRIVTCRILWRFLVPFFVLVGHWFPSWSALCLRLSGFTPLGLPESCPARFGGRGGDANPTLANLHHKCKPPQLMAPFSSQYMTLSL